MARTLERPAVLALAAALGLLVSPAAAQEPADPAYVVRTVARLQAQPLRGECSRPVAADRLVIHGGVSAETVKPGQADQEIDREVAAIEAIVEPLGGRVRVHERLRAVRSEPPSYPGRNDPPRKPFVAVQRLEIEVPAATEADPLLDRLLVSGLDRFGRNIQPEAGGRAARPVAVYRFDDLEGELDRLAALCRETAYDAWCAAHREGGEGGQGGTAERCRGTLEALDVFFESQRVYVTSEPVADAQGRVQPIQLAHPWPERQVEAVEVLTAEPVVFHATLDLRFQMPSR